jgi:hypothetical protein
MTFKPFSEGKRSGRSTASKRADAGEDAVRRAAEARMEETTVRRSSSEGDEDIDKKEAALALVVNRVGENPSTMTARRERKERLDTFMIFVLLYSERNV